MNAVDKRSGYVTESVVCVPITHAGGNVIAVVQMINKKPLGTSFNENDIHLLEDFAIHISLALSRVNALKHGDGDSELSFSTSTGRKKRQRKDLDNDDEDGDGGDSDDGDDDGDEQRKGTSSYSRARNARNTRSRR
jgi:GAF domain-containing protein